MELRRREFLELSACAVLWVVAADAAPADSLAVTSSRNSKLGRWVAHSHILYVPLPLFRAPPREGVTLSTSWAFLHFHEVTLTEAQLIAIARGGTVRVNDSGGAHSFSIELGHGSRAG